MIVMKFGGTSVGSAERINQVASLIESRIKDKLIVVLSAVGGITDLLISGGENAEHGIAPTEILEKIKSTHLTITRALGIDDSFIHLFLKELKELYNGILSLREFSARTRDVVASIGERLSVRIMAALLQKRGVPAKAFDAWEIGFITTSDHGQSKLLHSSNEQIKKSLIGLDVIPIITGFIGKDTQDRITTLGRGGSDFTASLIGAAVEVKCIEIWTDVPGIMTADPRIVPEAKSLSIVSFEEAAELSYFGAKILHPKTIEPAMQKNIPVLVKSTFEPNHAGTTILPKSPVTRGAKAVTSKKPITGLNIYSTGMLEARGFLTKVFHILEKHGMSVDVVATSQVSLSLTLDNTDNLEAALVELSEFSEVSVDKDLAIVCIVGEGMKSTPGIAGRLFRVVGESGVNIEIISQGASQINITFVVKSHDAPKIVKVIHREFFEQCR